MALNPKNFLDFEGLSQYDGLIKKYVQSQTGDVAAKALTDLTALSEEVAANTAAIEALNGEGEGSVKKAINDAIESLIDGAPEALNTLKELADWIAKDEIDTATLVQKVNDLSLEINAVQSIED